MAPETPIPEESQPQPIFPHLEAVRDLVGDDSIKRGALERFVDLGLHRGFLIFLENYPQRVFSYVSRVRDPMKFNSEELKDFGIFLEEASILMGHSKFAQQINGRLFEDLSFAFIIGTDQFRGLRVLDPQRTEEVFWETYGVHATKEGEFLDTRGGAEIPVARFDLKTEEKTFYLFMPDGIACDADNNITHVIEYKLTLQRSRKQAEGLKSFLHLMSSKPEGQKILKTLAKNLGLPELRLDKPRVVYVTRDTSSRSKIQAMKLIQGQKVLQDTIPQVEFIYIPFSVEEIILLRNALLADYCLQR